MAVSLGGLLAIGSAPTVAGGITIQGRLKWRIISVALEGRLDLPAYDDVRGGEISSSLVLGAIVPCVHHRYLVGCGILNVGALRAAGHDLANAEQVLRPYFSGGLRLGVELPLVSLLAVRVSGDLLVTFSRVTLVETGTGTELWTTPPLSGALSLAVVGIFR